MSLARSLLHFYASAYEMVTTNSSQLGLGLGLMDHSHPVYLAKISYDIDMTKFGYFTPR